MSKYKCIIFDCDGVLVDSEPISIQVLVDIANSYGTNIDLAYGMKHFKGSFFESCKKKISELTETEIPDTIEEEYRRKSFEAFKANMKAVEGVEDLIKNLSIPFCVASSGPEDKIRLNLGLSGLISYFENNIFSCYAIKKWKPDPAVFLWAAETMGFKPHECLVIEDSLSGVSAAKNGGFDVFGFTAHDYNNELKSEATKTFKSMPQLLDMI
ncbi:haloacid dehalogenase superfamily, subfamily IA, variant 3 with third motif having DD or ED/haloacid dehalogenase superfamily, subfamily IA, variant 1 with third motif having Dx(3-4)D or Dx(3-4)E [Flaviramulus basaltis]|uniref:Haloacid dehalogenase superfamily, subfamily IA, variant 3 with third motif having DD or ED/haloacid dehalogenase superfamily, subfamily IA, variant 1 with third motif having Dx(3-4)D or Dx(3-4)E n=1 Tax=Flaviramulus basaltis TaxID=369401 RepID=A0A1K2IAQ1_9FLAO|nr:HAD family hydrolase [Flaviramulus basaltis]SFZ89318.1 haloacid dehalogenase superfamily, subfamily IA, variant 3 with third motif having DD or ED/haloacid dehalogenase superfamily, subfamily IA, variant 1 with third motif having Dx(3-4)D or Dx(3-4)E [Flaviramulus basaltis]